MYIFGGRGDRHSPFHTQDEIYCHQIMYLVSVFGVVVIVKIFNVIKGAEFHFS